MTLSFTTLRRFDRRREKNTMSAAPPIISPSSNIRTLRDIRLLLLDGIVIAGGVPGMVLLTVGSVVGVAGASALVVWPLSALIGGGMAYFFAGVVSRNPSENGGIAIAAGRVFERRGASVSAVTQWSYWLGWSPTPAIYGATIG